MIRETDWVAQKQRIQLVWMLAAPAAAHPAAYVIAAETVDTGNKLNLTVVPVLTVRLAMNSLMALSCSKLIGSFLWKLEN